VLALRIGTVKNAKNFLRVRWAGARDECGSWERIYRNNGKFDVDFS
jgi:hypothetical protein